MEDEGQQPHKTISAVLKDLQPIKDLAKNWDIDIASCLEEYLQELEHSGELGDVPMGVGNDEGVKTNFAQAALLLHNSSHVYSRKVEYLYSLVYQALDSLSTVNSQKRASKGRPLDPEIEDFREFDPHQEFLLLDDVLPTDKSDDCRHINLVPTPMDQEASRRLSLASRRASSLSASDLMKTPRGNISLRTQNLSSSTMGRSFHTLGVSRALAQISTQSSAVLRLMDDQCNLDPSGRLVVPGAQSSPNLVPPSNVEAPGVDSEYAAGGDYVGDNHDDYDDDGPGFMMNDDEDGVGGESQPAAAPPTAKKRVTFAVERETESVPDKPDPWAFIDPHTSDTRKSRPMKLGKTLRLPPGIDDLPSDCVTGSRTRKWKAPVPLPTNTSGSKTFFATQTFHALSRKRRLEDDEEEMDSIDHADTSDSTEGKMPVVPLKGLVYGEEFAYLAREYAQKKAAERRLLRRRRRGQESGNESTNFGEENNRNDAFGDLDDDDDYGPGYVYDDDDNDFGGFPTNDDPASSPMIETNAGLLAVEEVYRERSQDDTDSVVDARAFEALCRAHIDKFAKGAEKYASATQLTQRVDKWQEKLEPLLAEEEERPEFDIHQYGQNILVSVEQALEKERTDDDKSDPVVNFAQVTKDYPNYQVCRYFLASLCLCNTGNVLLDQAQDSTNSLSVRLLSKDYSRPMETYQAPSAVEQNV